MRESGHLIEGVRRDRALFHRVFHAVSNILAGLLRRLDATIPKRTWKLRQLVEWVAAVVCVVFI